MNCMLLDCTLRDGGYLNNWAFGYSTIRYMADRLQSAGVDVIELGFLDERVQASRDRTIFPDTTALDAVYGSMRQTGSLLVAMIDYGTCSIDKLSPCADTVLDGIRIIFKQPKAREAIAFGKQVKALGYKVFMQMVSVTTYDDPSLLEFVEMIREMMPYAVGIVDTYGLLHREEMQHIFRMLDDHLPPEIILGYHDHNNFQLAYANSIEFLKGETDRTLLVDSTVYGMGKSAGNTPTELIAMTMNECHGKHYDLNQILQAIDVVVLRLKEKYEWGYNLKFFLSAANDCHPNYLTWLLGKKTLSIKSVNEIIQNIEPSKKLNYDERHVEALYAAYQSSSVDDTDSLNRMREKLAGREVLLAGPGATLSEYNLQIRKYIADRKPVVITANFAPEEQLGIRPDLVMFASGKRFLISQERIEQLPRATRLAATSNVTGLSTGFDYVLNFEKWKDDDPDLLDNCGAILLRVLSTMDLIGITLCGFDGFHVGGEDFASAQLSYVQDMDRLARVNRKLAERIAQTAARVPVAFLTPSLYQQQEPLQTFPENT